MSDPSSYGMAPPGGGAYVRECHPSAANNVLPIRCECTGPPSNTRVKLPARPLQSRIAFVRLYASVSSSIAGAPGRTGRRNGLVETASASAEHCAPDGIATRLPGPPSVPPVLLGSSGS
jgi:hypothetical protein